MGRLVFASAVASVLVFSSAAGAKSWPSLEFRPATASPGDIVSVRVSLTHADYDAPPRPGGPRIEIFLVPAHLARTVNSAAEPTVVRVAVIHADLDWRGRAFFKLPYLPSGGYAGAYRVAGAFHPPRSSAPLDAHGFSLEVRREDGRSSVAPLVIAVCSALLLAGLVAGRRRLVVRVAAAR